MNISFFNTIVSSTTFYLVLSSSVSFCLWHAPEQSFAFDNRKGVWSCEMKMESSGQLLATLHHTSHFFCLTDFHFPCRLQTAGKNNNCRYSCWWCVANEATTHVENSTANDDDDDEIISPFFLTFPHLIAPSKWWLAR